MTTDPVKKKLLTKYAEDGGVNLADIFDVEQKSPEQIVEQKPGGGGISAPSVGASLPGKSMQTV